MTPEFSNERKLPLGGSNSTPGARSRHEWTDEEIAALVGDLESLRGGELTAAALIGVGPRAIAFVADFLLQGAPRAVFQPRQLAVEVLAELGAKEALIRYLIEEREIPDAVVRHGEEAVQSAAGRALGRWKTEDVYEALRAVSQRRNLPGVVESLGEFRRPEMAGYFLETLGDDGSRAAAREALRKLGEGARMAVLAAAVTPEPSAEEETPSSRIRRREAAGLLGEWKLPVSDWAKVRGLLDDPDPAIQVPVAGIALAIAPPADCELACRRLIAALVEGDAFLQIDATRTLRRHYERLRPLIDAEIAARESKPIRERNADAVLRALLALRESEGQ